VIVGQGLRLAEQPRHEEEEPGDQQHQRLAGVQRQGHRAPGQNSGERREHRKQDGEEQPGREAAQRPRRKAVPGLDLAAHRDEPKQSQADQQAEEQNDERSRKRRHPLVVDGQVGERVAAAGEQDPGGEQDRQLDQSEDEQGDEAQPTRGAAQRCGRVTHRLTDINYRPTIIYIRHSMVATQFRPGKRKIEESMMRNMTWLIAAGLLAAASPRAEAQSEPAPIATLFDQAERGDLRPLERAVASAHGDEAVLLRARIAAARFDPRAARDPALARIAEHGTLPQREAALAIVAGAGFANGDYAAAARAGRRLAEAQAARGDGRAAETERMWRLAELLAAQPAQRIERAAPGSVAARTDKVGLPRIDIQVNGRPQEAVFDTGASLSVLSAETARRLGVTILEQAAEVGNGVQGTVPVRLGIADRVEVAGTVLRNHPFLIIDDAQLTFPQVPGGYDIRAIFGLPAMRALGRMRMEAERLTVLAPEEGAAGAPNLAASGNQLYVETGVDGRILPLHLDTGANQTSLTPLYAAAEPARIAGLAAGRVQLASAGGTRASTVATWTDAPLTLAGRTLRLPQLPVRLAGEGPEARDYGTLGSNALRTFQSYTLDLRTMRLELGEPVRPAP
jgi:predicted aspartyl protease